MIIAIVAIFLVALYFLKELMTSAIVTGAFALIVGGVFYQYILWVLVFGLLFLGAMFFLFFIADRADD